MDSTQIEIIDSLIQAQYSNDSIKWINAVAGKDVSGGNNYELIIAIVSIVIALGSVIFAFLSARAAQRTNRIGVFTQLYQMYLSDELYRAHAIVFDIYKICDDKIENPISSYKAKAVLTTTEINTVVKKAINDTTNFWRYIELLVRENYLDEKVAFQGFASPQILGFLYPIEKAWTEKVGDEYKTKALEKFYHRFKKSKK